MDQTGTGRQSIKLRVYAFVVTRMETGRYLGQGLICPAARYASRSMMGGDGLERLSAAGYTWQAIEHELSDTSQAAPVLRSTTLFQLLAGRIDVAVAARCSQVRDVEIESPEQSTQVLDAYLSALVIPAGH